MSRLHKAAVLGTGSWGTALAAALTHNADSVSLWGREKKTADSINETGRNERYLPGLRLPAGIHATTQLEEALRDAEIAVFALPTASLAEIAVAAKGWISPVLPVVSSSKGLCTKTHRFPTRILQEALGRPSDEEIYVLTGPSFAEETARGGPTAVAFVNPSLERATRWGHAFFTPTMRAYPGTDVIGVEVAGAVKNVIALAAGASDGLKLGTNSRSALITRGLAEMTRFGAALGADPMTFLGLAGVGDLVLTCTGALSRNRRLGMLLAEGVPIDQALAKLGQVAEGVATTKSVHAVAKKLGVTMPITREVHAVLFEGKSPREALFSLMTRPLHPEDRTPA